MSLAVIRDTSPSRHHRHLDVREVIAELRRANPRMGENGLSERLAERIEEDRRLLLDASRVLVRQALSAVEIVRRRRHQDGRTPEERAERRAAAKAEVTKLVAKVREVAVLDMLMQNGIAMRFNTGTQMGAYGKAYSAIAAKVGTAMVGEVMVEAEVRELLQAAAA
jgi:hypothetical protein